MRIRAQNTNLAVAVGLTLTLSGCSGDSTTGWIPHDGTINGVITVTSALPAAPRSAPMSLARAVLRGGPALPLAPRLPPFARQPIPHAGRVRPDRAPVAAPQHDLIITFRHAALGAPPLGSAALRSAGSAKAVGAAMRGYLAAHAIPGTVVTGVSPAILTAKIRVADTAELESIAAGLRRDPAFAAVTRTRFFWLERPAYVRAGTPGAAASAGARTTPNDPFYPFQSWHYGLVDLPRAWTITQGSGSVLVAVVDDGIRFDHPAIRPNLTSDGYDFVNGVDSLPLCAGGFIKNADDGTGYDPDPTSPASFSLDSTGTCYLPDDLGNHGLHVAGTIGAAGNDNLGVTGVNWTVSIRPVRALGVGGFGETYDIAQAILYAAGLPADNGAGGTVQPSTGARVINLSLGGPGDDTTLHNAIKSAVNAGVLVVAAAGNAGTATPQFPAGYPEVLAVAAVGPDGEPAAYSSFGPYVGIRAPGGNFALGDATDGVASTIWSFGTKQPDYAFAEGTSMAAPHVSGVAALLLAHEPGLTAAALRTRLTTYAVGPPTAYGAGLLNAYNSLTQSFGPPTQLYAVLYSASTGARLATVLTQTGGAFTFGDVADGAYLVYGGVDEGGDQGVGVAGRLWGAFGGAAFPAAVTVLGTGPYSVSFPIGLPATVQPNHTIASANVLMLGGYVRSTYVDTTMIDYYRVTVPARGTYVFETSGWLGACGFALDEATALGLFNGNGTFITSTGFISPGHYNFCSRLTTSLTPGTYYVGVAGAFQPGQYQLQARFGP